MRLGEPRNSLKTSFVEDKKEGKSVQPLQEKATYKSFPVLHRHSRVIVQRLLQVRKSALNFVVCIGHSCTFRTLKSKQIRQVKINAVYHGSHLSVQITTLAVLVRNALVQEICISLFPSRIFCFKTLLCQVFHLTHKQHQINRRLKPTCGWLYVHTFLSQISRLSTRVPTRLRRSQHYFVYLHWNEPLSRICSPSLVINNNQIKLSKTN